MTTTKNGATIAKEALGGAFWTAPAGTALPTEEVIDAYLNGSGSDDYKTVTKGFSFVSEVSEDGIALSEETDSEEFKNMNGNTVLTVSTSRTETITVKFIEMNETSLKELYGAGNVTKTEGNNFKVAHNSDESPERVAVLLIALVDGRRMVRVVPRYKVTERGDETLAPSALLARDITCTTYTDDDGNTVIDYLTDEAKGE